MHRHFGRLLVLTCITAWGCATPPKVSESVDPFAPLPEPAVTRVAVAPERSIESLKDAIRLLKEGQFAQADANLEEVRRVRPDIPEVHFNLGMAKLQRRKYPEAVGHFRDFIVLRPQDPGAYAMSGIALREQGRFEEAEKSYREGLAIAPNNGLLHYNIGILYDLYLDVPEKALEHYLAYQKIQTTPDARVGGWIAVLERDTKKRDAAQSKSPSPTETGSPNKSPAAPPKVSK